MGNQQAIPAGFSVEWRRALVSGDALPQLEAHSAAVDAATGLVYVFGGLRSVALGPESDSDDDGASGTAGDSYDGTHIAGPDGGGEAGGMNVELAAVPSNDVLQLRLAHDGSLEVRRLLPLGAAPSPRTGAAIAVHGGSLYCFGGLDPERGWMNDLYRLELAGEADGQPRWHACASSAPPPDLVPLAAPQSACASCPSPRDKMSFVTVELEGAGVGLVVFGGFGPVPPSSAADDDAASPATATFSWFDDCYFLSLESLEWHRVEVDGAKPLARCAAAAVARGSQVYIVAGKAATGRRNDAHVLHLSHTDRGVLGRWEELRGPGLLPPERSFGAAALAAPHKLVLFGGLSKTNQHLADLHVLDLQNNAWVQVESFEGEQRVPPRASHALVALPRADRAPVLLALCGSADFDDDTQSATTIYNDAWLLDAAPIAAAPVPTPPPQPQPQGQPQTPQ